MTTAAAAPPATAESTSSSIAGEAQFCADAARVLRSLGRTDLATRVDVAAARLRRPATLICIVGEFKQGKSSLVNALIGQEVCPVDDDLATSAITVLHHGDPAQTVVHRRDGDQKLNEIVANEALASYVSEQGNPDNSRRIDRVDVALPNPLLDRGLMLVDTPGMGGLGAGHAAATLAFLPYADALLFVSDASMELSAPELEFLRRAVSHCPTVVFCLTKTDLHPDWRRIATINEGHLRRAGVAARIVPLSSKLRMLALRTADRELNAESGFPELLRIVHEDVLDEARAAGAAHAVREGRTALDQVLAADRTEFDLLNDPSTVSAGLAELERSRAELEHLRGPAARWNVLLADRLAELGAEVNYRFKGAMRDIARDFEESVEKLSNAAQWDSSARDIQRDVAVAVTDTFSALTDGGTAIQAEIEALLRAEVSGPALGGLVPSLDVSALWRAMPADLKPGVSRRMSAGVGQAFDGLRGAQGGIMVLALLQMVLPAAAGAVILTNPFLIGFGLFSGGRTMLDGRKRRLAAQRQKLRQAVRQFADDVQFETANELSTSLRTMQQQLRSHFTDRMAELSRTASELAQQAQANAALTGPAADARRATLQQRITVLADVLRMADPALAR